MSRIMKTIHWQQWNEEILCREESCVDAFSESSAISKHFELKLSEKKIIKSESNDDDNNFYFFVSCFFSEKNVTFGSSWLGKIAKLKSRLQKMFCLF